LLFKWVNLYRYAVEKHVRAMVNKRAEEQMEQVRLGQRADKLRLEGEAQLQAIGDLDEDSDSEGDGDEHESVGGAMGRARRRGRKDGKFDKPGDVVVRAMTPAELGMAYAWMKRDQKRRGAPPGHGGRGELFVVSSPTNLF
jgi:hypothetical protein